MIPTTGQASSFARWKSKTNYFCFFGILLIPKRSWPLDSTREFHRQGMMTRLLAKAARDMPNGWAPVTPMKFSSDFSRSSHILLFFRKTRDITGWAKAGQGGASCTPWRTPLSRTTTTAGPCSTGLNGSERSAEHRSATCIIPAHGAALRPRPGMLLLTWRWTLDTMSFGNFGRRLRGNFVSPSAIRTSRHRMRFLPEDNLRERGTPPHFTIAIPRGTAFTLFLMPTLIE
jgi:hypothetical protein